MKWDRRKIPLNANGRTHQDAYTSCSEEGIYCVLDAGGGDSEIFCGELFRHWVTSISFDGKTPKEPNYRQKVVILKELGIWKEIALEVMPPEMEVIDRQDVYHLWEFQYPYSFIYQFTPIFDEPEKFEKEIDGVKYHLKRVGRTRYLYMRATNGAELTWRKKQNLKNLILTPFDTAVEIITEAMIGKKYTCLVCLPTSEFLDFGLT